MNTPFQRRLDRTARQLAKREKRAQRRQEKQQEIAKLSAELDAYVRNGWSESERLAAERKKRGAV